MFENQFCCYNQYDGLLDVDFLSIIPWYIEKYNSRTKTKTQYVILCMKVSVQPFCPHC